MRLSEIIQYLEKHKHILGLEQYKILVDKNFTEVENLVVVEPDIYEKVLKFTLSNEFKKKKDLEQKSILIHELIHGRYNIFEKEKETITLYLEESFCNDLERGIIQLLREIEDE